MKVKFKKYTSAACVPTKATTSGPACYNVYSTIDVKLAPGVTKKIPLNLGFKFSKRYVCRICLRSNLSFTNIYWQWGSRFRLLWKYISNFDKL